jgi:hypothetical protein
MSAAGAAAVDRSAVVERWVQVLIIIAVDPDLGAWFPVTSGSTIETHTPAGRNDHHGATGYLEEPASGQAFADAMHG